MSQPHSQVRSTPRARPGSFDPMQMLMAFAQILSGGQTNRMDQQRELFGGIRRDMSGQPIDPSKNTDPFTNGFFQSGASDLSGLDIAKSQGSNAVNQWGRPDIFGPQKPPTESPADAAKKASPPPFDISPSSKRLISGRRPRTGGFFSFLR